MPLLTVSAGNAVNAGAIVSIYSLPSVQMPCVGFVWKAQNPTRKISQKTWSTARNARTAVRGKKCYTATGVVFCVQLQMSLLGWRGGGRATDDVFGGVRDSGIPTVDAFVGGGEQLQQNMLLQPIWYYTKLQLLRVLHRCDGLSPAVLYVTMLLMLQSLSSPLY